MGARRSQLLSTGATTASIAKRGTTWKMLTIIPVRAASVAVATGQTALTTTVDRGPAWNARYAIVSSRGPTAYNTIPPAEDVNVSVPVWSANRSIPPKNGIPIAAAWLDALVARKW